MYMTFDYCLMFVCHNKSHSMLVRGTNPGNKTMRRQSYKEESACDGIFDISQQRIDFCCINTMEVTYFTFCYISQFFVRTSIINSESICACVYFPHLYSYFNMYDIWTTWLNVNNDKIEKSLCNNWQVRSVSERWKNISLEMCLLTINFHIHSLPEAPFWSHLFGRCISIYARQT